MKRTHVPTALAMLLAMAAATGVLGCQPTDTRRPTPPPNVETTPASPTAPATGTTPTTQTVPPGKVGVPAGNVAAVEIANRAFKPGIVEVSVGDTVIWTNQDAEPHTVSGAGWSSARLEQGSTYSATFTEPGTYEYTCSIHPSMNGTVEVE